MSVEMAEKITFAVYGRFQALGAVIGGKDG
jgi:hypothetical protein